MIDERQEAQRERMFCKGLTLGCKYKTLTKHAFTFNQSVVNIFLLHANVKFTMWNVSNLNVIELNQIYAMSVTNMYSSYFATNLSFQNYYLPYLYSVLSISYLTFSNTNHLYILIKYE